MRSRERSRMPHPDPPSSSRPSSATWRALDRDRRWHVDVSALRGADDRGRPRAARLHRQRDRAPARLGRLRADRPLRRDSPTSRRGLLRAVGDAELRRRSAADPARRSARRRARLRDRGRDHGGRARAVADRAGEPAGERQLAELRLLVGGPDPLRGLDLLDGLDATAAVLPELAALHGVGQNPNHHLDVHDHTVEVLANLLEIERDLGRYAGESAGEVDAPARRAARRRDDAGNGASLRRPAARLGEADRPARSTARAGSPSSATIARGWPSSAGPSHG